MAIQVFETDEQSQQGETEVDERTTVAGRYVLVDEIGRGGMGIVYRALDLRRQEMQDRNPHIAIKILGDEFRRHPLAIISLQRESRKSQSLAHPNILTVYDFDRDGDTAFITMELLEGQSLADVISERSGFGMPWSEAAPLVIGMAQGLAYAHQQGIVHADFKPGNVFVTRQGQIKILDFGIAQAVREGEGHGQEGTAFDVSELGALSPAYASVELLAGEPPVPSDDVFALGVVIEEMVGGQHPFGGRSVLNSQVDTDKLKASSRLPGSVRSLVSRMLSWRRAGRPRDAGEVLAGLQRRSTHMPFAVPVPIAITAVVALGGIIALAWLLYDWQSSEPISTAPTTIDQASQGGGGILAERVDLPSTPSDPPRPTGLVTTAYELNAIELSSMDEVSRQNLCNLLDSDWYQYSCDSRQLCYALLAEDRRRQAAQLPAPLSMERIRHAQLYSELSATSCDELTSREQDFVSQFNSD